MKIKSILLGSAAMLIAISANAQDKIHLRNGDVVDGKVSEIGTRDVSYKKADNPDGPSYRIGKGEISRIEYENGSEDVFSRGQVREAKPDAPKLRYGKNIIAAAPLQVCAGIGVGLSYERVLDKKGIMSFYLPAAIGFNNDNYNNMSPWGSQYPGYSTHVEYTTYAVMPGVKIYPTGSKGKVRYAVGPSIAAIFGKDYGGNVFLGYDTWGYPVYGGGLNDRFTLGVLINNSLNIQPTPHLYIGLELGLGMTYINQRNSVDVGEDMIGQFAFRLGYRF